MDYSREFLKRHNVFRYRMKKIEDMSESEVSKVCHWFCEENNLTSEFKDFVFNRWIKRKAFVTVRVFKNRLTQINAIRFR